MAERLHPDTSSEGNLIFRRRLARELLEHARLSSAESREILGDITLLCELGETYLGQRPNDNDQLFAAMHEAYDAVGEEHRACKQAAEILRGNGITKP